MILFGGEFFLYFLKPLFFKSLGIKIKSSIATQLAQATGQHVGYFAHAVGTNILASASHASNAYTAVYILLKGGGSGVKFMQKVEKIKSKQTLKAQLKATGNEGDQTILLTAFITMELLEAYYASLKRPAALKKYVYDIEDPRLYKLKISQMESCDDCHCMDFVFSVSACPEYKKRNGGIHDDTDCVCNRSKCGHRLHDHSFTAIPDADQDQEDINTRKYRWLMRDVAGSLYRNLMHRAPDGHVKFELAEIEKCSEENCSCGDFNFERKGMLSTYCTCGHRSWFHRANYDEVHSIAWIIGLVVSEIIKEFGYDQAKKPKEQKKPKGAKVKIKVKRYDSDEGEDDESIIGDWWNDSGNESDSYISY